MIAKPVQMKQARLQTFFDLKLKSAKNWTTWYMSFEMPSNFPNEEVTIAKLVQMKQARLQAVLTWSSKSEKNWTTW